MSWLSKVTSSVGSSVKNSAGNIAGGIKSHNFGQVASGAFDLSPVGMASNVYGAHLNPFEQKKAPGAPGINPDLQNLQKNQMDYAHQFRQDLPGIQNQMQGQLTRDTNTNLQGQQRATRSANSARGLLYGGVNAGQEAGNRAQAQRGLLAGNSEINLGLQNAANQMDQAAIQTGVNIQSQQQSMQNAVYQNAMAAQAGQNQMAGSLASTGLMAAML